MNTAKLINNLLTAYKLTLLALLIISFHSESYSNDKNNFYIGLSAGGNYIFNSSDMPYILGDWDCGQFSGGTAQGINAGIKFGYQTKWDFLTLETRFLYDNRPMDLSGNSDCFEVLAPSEKLYVPLVRKHKYSATMTYLAFTAGFVIKPIKKYPLSFAIMFDAGNPIFKSDYTLSESIISPQGVAYPDGKTSKVNSQGQVANASTSLGTSLSAIYQYFLSPNLSTDIELGLRYAINSSITDYKHKSNIVRLNISMNYHFGAEKPKQTPPIIIEEVEEIAPPVVEAIAPPKRITIYDVSASKLEITETTVTQTFPLLQYYFFEESHSDLPDKYKSTIPVSEFSENLLDKDNMVIYYNSLDVIASRLKKFGGSLTITGHTDGIELDSTQGELSLATARAQSVADYLIDKWDIPSSRFIISARKFPENPTNPNYLESASENRRVELNSADLNLFAPVVHRDFFEYSNRIKQIILSIKSPKPALAYIQILTESGISILKKQDRIELGNNNLIIQLTQDQINSLARYSKSEDIFLEITFPNDELIDNIRMKLDIKVNPETYEIGRLNLIVFDFDQASLNTSNRNLLTQFVGTSLRPSSEITIIGSTDILGTTDYNQQLSQRRAMNTQNFILSLDPDAQFKEVRGLGAEQSRYDNNLPEGRFYNRTVLIEVKTPLENK